MVKMTMEGHIPSKTLIQNSICHQINVPIPLNLGGNVFLFHIFSCIQTLGEMITLSEYVSFFSFQN